MHSPYIKQRAEDSSRQLKAPKWGSWCLSVDSCNSVACGVASAHELFKESQIVLAFQPPRPMAWCASAELCVTVVVSPPLSIFCNPTTTQPPGSHSLPCPWDVVGKSSEGGVPLLSQALSPSCLHKILLVFSA